MTTSPFTGLGVALATPFRAPVRPRRDEALPRVASTGGPRSATPAVDFDAFERMIEHVVSGGVDFLVVLGSTGEAATVTDAERAELVHLAVERAGSVPVVVGVGHQDTVRTCELALAARDCGAGGLLVVTPFYNKPQPAGIEAHFAQVAATVPGMPIIAYNVPGRTGTNLTPATMARLWTIPEVVAVKESSGDLRQITQMCLQAPAGRHVLAGDDDLALPAIAVGARGLISVCANVAPAPTSALVSAAMEGDMGAARHHLARLSPLMAAMFAETNPVPVKAGLAALGFGTGMVRAPLAPAEPDTWSAVHSALAGLQQAEHLGAAS
ncbi:MAG TPA: 4-hydroxy-tetrahydrodipicolinate synthase [Ornithinimicrobium sp.]|uniref:4-hydroxy-tetrahydrodipicolinate synthase n=1 Tax=Ornithinimicrobium sp. TaxID=1977084 RepID=UPI002B4912DD|nr:4-hydroxy-tetrahydrodipicolinate synthase [Ornithinimicrobium sp.]HKJ11488.1 4-hydroxy-tetrahydrodipicolinate synthase [Ornithinimicrobium sp.]